MNRIGEILSNMPDGEDGNCTTGTPPGGHNDLSRDSFIEAVCARARECGWPDAAVQAELALSEFLRDEKIEYGDPGFGWTKDDAYTFANEYLLRE